VVPKRAQPPQQRAQRIFVTLNVRLRTDDKRVHHSPREAPQEALVRVCWRVTSSEFDWRVSASFACATYEGRAGGHKANVQARRDSSCAQCQHLDEGCARQQLQLQLGWAYGTLGTTELRLLNNPYIPSLLIGGWDCAATSMRESRAAVMTSSGGTCEEPRHQWSIVQPGVHPRGIRGNTLEPLPHQSSSATRASIARTRWVRLR
jgi:hypothetical protein